MPHAVAAALPSLLVVAARIRAEQHAARLERVAQFYQHARQCLPRHVEQRRVREHTVESQRRKIELQEVLFPHLATGQLTRHRRELGNRLEADRVVDENFECGTVSYAADAVYE